MADARNLVLTVCTGNICRSPMAQRLLQHAIDAEPSLAGRLQTASAGVAAPHGEPASENSVIALRKVGLDLSGHRSQQLSADLVARSFAIFGMTGSHLEVIHAAFPGLPDRVHLFRGFIGADEPVEIPDPIGQGIDAYRAALDAMIEAIPSLVTYLRTEYNDS